MKVKTSENNRRTIVTLPMNADLPPRRAIPTATLAGAPPAAFLNAGASAKETPFVVGTKSISISPKQTTSEDSLASNVPLLPGCALAKTCQFLNQKHV